MYLIKRKRNRKFIGRRLQGRPRNEISIFTVKILEYNLLLDLIF